MNKKLFHEWREVLLALSVLTNVVIIGGLTYVGVYISKHKAEVFQLFGDEYTAYVKNEPGRGANESLLSQDAIVTSIVERANPAVVSIIVSKDVPILKRYIQRQNDSSFPSIPGFPSDFFESFGFGVPQYKEVGKEKKEVGGGSGFFVSEDGLIVTNKHVVSDMDAEYTVFTNDGKKHEVEVVARDPVLDVAILRVKGTGFPYLSFADSSDVKLGQSVIAIGNALGEFRNSVSLGVVSGLSRSTTAFDSGTGVAERLEQVIQTDAAINPGNSGGPLIDLSGRVVGVNVAVVQGSQSIGFALLGSEVSKVVESVKSTGKIVRPFVGIRYVPITEELQKKNSLSVDYGIVVIRGQTDDELAVVPGSPADKAGIVENDIILSVDGIKLTDSVSFASLIRTKSVGDTVRLNIVHKGAKKDVSLKLEAYPTK
jgi:serine protease Do